MSFAQSILTLIFDFLSMVISFLLSPIDLLISQFLPNINGLLNYVSSMLDVAITYVSFIVDSLCIPHDVMVLIVEYLIFRLTLPLFVYIIKLAVKWYNYLKF